MSVTTEPQIHLWTQSEYYKMAEIGLFDHKRVELIEGQVIEMSPMGSLHATSVALAARAVERVFGDAYFVRWQMPFDAGEHSAPEPDIAVVTGSIRDYTTQHPTNAALLIEVAETSLHYDRTEKVSLYAKAGIADYWIINLVARQLEVYRTPVYDPNALCGFTYADTLVLTPKDTVSALGRPGITISVSDLLP